jgi:branched-chain amino acid transport system permease protein
MTAVTEASPLTAAVARRINPTSIAVAVLAVVAIVAPFLVNGVRTQQLTQILIYAIALLGLNLLTGFSGQISLGNGAFYAVGAYTAGILIEHYHVPYWVTPPIAGAVCFGFGWAFGRSVVRLEGLYLALATFALASVMPSFIKLDAVEPWTKGAMSLQVTKPASPIDQLSQDQWLYFFCLLLTVIVYVVAWNVIRGRTGRTLTAIRDHTVAASTMGIDVVRYKSLAFGVSALYTGIAGSLSILIVGLASPDSFSILLSIQLLVGVIVGGIASFLWMLFGATFIEFLPDVSNVLSQSAPQVLSGAFLILFMIAMPGGMAGLVRSARFWHATRSTNRTRT